MARETPANIRVMVLQSTNDTCVKPNLPALTRGVRWLRFGRYIISTTTTPGVFIVCVVAEDCSNGSTYIGPIASLQTIVSQEMRDAWQAGASGERDND